MRRRWRQHRQHQPAEMNITAFLNLMVILVPFLLITAVFSRIAILELTLPPPQAQEDIEKEPPRQQLEIVLRADRLEVAAGGAAPELIPKTAGGYDLAALSRTLRRIKQRHPDKTDATLLLEPDVSYDELIQVMDTVRMIPVRSGNTLIQAELFPDISIGDAPVVQGSGS